jgi:hypothetical protein
MEIKKRYLQFPLSLLREFHIDKSNTINKIFQFGICHFALNHKRENDLNSMVNHFIYVNYQNKLPSVLEELFDGELENFGGNLDYKGFNGNGELEPFDEEREELINFFENNEYAKNLAFQLFDISLAKKYLRFMPSDDSYLLNAYGEIKIATKEDVIFPMVNVDSLFNFINNEKNEFETMQFLAFIGIKSILGTKKYIKTNYGLIFARAFGYNSVKDVPKALSKEIQPIYDKYKIRWHRDKIKNELEDKWNLITYSNNTRGFYVSVDSKFSLEDLALVGESSKKKNKDLKRKTDKAEATKKALEKLGISK